MIQYLKNAYTDYAKLIKMCNKWLKDYWIIYILIIMLAIGPIIVKAAIENKKRDKLFAETLYDDSDLLDEDIEL